MFALVKILSGCFLFFLAFSSFLFVHLEYLIANELKFGTPTKSKGCLCCTSFIIFPRNLVSSRFVVHFCCHRLEIRSLFSSVAVATTCSLPCSFYHLQFSSFVKAFIDCFPTLVVQIDSIGNYPNNLIIIQIL